jgi:hypothetical protein
MTQPQISLDSYSEKAIVLRAVPDDYFKAYANFLKELGGTWNPYLKAPSGQGVLGGWIFPKKKEDQVRQGVNQILSGQVTPQPVYSSQPQTLLTQQQPQPLLTLQQPQVITNQPQTNNLQQLLSTAQARHMSVQTTTPVMTVPTVNSCIPISSIPPGYQQIIYIVIKPEVGGTLHLNAGGQKIPVKVESVEMSNGITNQAIIKLPDNQETMIRLTDDHWTIPNYEEAHSISLQ